ncbi:MAG: hypothetical protein WBE56_04685 [Terracidiphilus sp.]
MDPIAYKFQDNLLRNRLALRTFICTSLARQLDTASYIEKPAIMLRREETLKECHLLQFVLDLVERQQKEKRGAGDIAMTQAAMRGLERMPEPGVQ